MHELSIAMSIFESVKRHLPADKNIQVKKILLRAGKLTAIYPPALETCMSMVSRNTPLENAELIIKEAPIRVRCRSCNSESDLEQPPFICGICGGDQVDIISGRELFVESIEVEELKDGG